VEITIPLGLNGNWPTNANAIIMSELCKYAPPPETPVAPMLKDYWLDMCVGEKVA
jgi:hypothetical protein